MSCILQSLLIISNKNEKHLSSISLVRQRATRTEQVSLLHLSTPRVGSASWVTVVNTPRTRCQACQCSQ